MRPAQAIMADLAAAGLSEGQLALVMELSAAVATEARPVEDRAANRRRSRDREYQAEKRRQNRPISADAPPKESKSNPPHSEPNGSGGEPPDPLKQVFDLGVELLTAAGHSEREARSIIGKFNKTHSAGDVLTGLIECRTKAIVNPVEWLTKRFKPAKYVSASGYEYRGSLEQIEREARRRNDNDTYWQVQVDKKEERLHA